MTTNLHLQGQTTAKHDLPLTHLEYGYVEKCTNLKELEKILKILRSGDEGRYPDLESFTEDRIRILSPKSRLLRKEDPILRPGDLSKGDWQNIEQDLKTWTNDMHTRDSHKSDKDTNDFTEGDENLPPVRSMNIVLEGKKQKQPEQQKKAKRVMPRDYKEWDKVDVDAELEKVDQEVKERPGKSHMNGVSIEIDGSGLSEAEKALKSDREKDKGNEAYRAGDYDESVMYYCRSLSLMPNVAAYNNRALAYLKLEKWDEAVNDCNSVLNKESQNIKAMLRRGTAYKNKEEFISAKADFEKVLELEENNKKAETLMKEVDDEILKQEKLKKEKGRRMVIEEVEDESDDEDIEHIEVEKPMVNGFKSHKAEQVKPGQEKQSSNNSGVSFPSGSSKVESMSKSDSSSSKSNQLREPSEPVSNTESCTNAETNNSHKQDTPRVCSLPKNNVSGAALPSEHVKLSSPTSSISSHKPSPSSLSQAAALSSETNSQPSTASSVSPDTVSTSKSVSDFNRPVIIQSPLSPEVLKLKEEGNSLFRSGQYGTSVEVYSKAISRIGSDSEQRYNLSVLYSNRAASHLKTGNCNAAISDCDQSLQLVPHGTKSLLRRAAAFEAKEKYSMAYVDYKHAVSVDVTSEQAHQGSSRCQAMLQQLHGPRTWRDKIPALQHVQPWEVPIIVDKDSQTAKEKVSSSSASSNQNQPHSVHETSKTVGEAKLPCNTSAKKELPKEGTRDGTPSPKKQPSFEELKTAGNQHVQKGEYLKATACYTRCIAMSPEQVASYTNRALCYLKLDMATEAETDCDKALILQPDNAKALYRRALARKKLQHYKSSLQDLIELLKLEPKNTAAKKEIDVVKLLYKDELGKLKQKKASDQDLKPRRRMKIEEVDDDDDEEKPSRVKQAEKSKYQPKARGAKSSQPASAGKSKSNHSGKKSSQTQDSSVAGQPVAPPIAPRLMKTTPYEFCQAWNSLRPCQGIQPYAEILRQISPADLPSVISNKLDGQMLQIIVRSVNEEMVLKGEVERGYQILDSLRKVPRFSTVSMFMSTKEKKEVSSVLDVLCQSISSAYTKDDIARLKKEYSVK